MPITRTPIIDDSGGGSDGTVIDNAWKQQFYDQIDALLVGGGVSAVSDTPFVAGDYTGSGSLVWTVAAGHITANWYQIVGKLLTWNVAIAGSATSGTPAGTLNVRIPNTLTANKTAVGFGKLYQTASGWVDVTLTAAVNQLQVTRTDNTNFAIDGNTWLRYQVHIAIA